MKDGSVVWPSDYLVGRYGCMVRLAEKIYTANHKHRPTERVLFTVRGSRFAVGLNKSQPKSTIPLLDTVHVFFATGAEYPSDIICTASYEGWLFAISKRPSSTGNIE